MLRSLIVIAAVAAISTALSHVEHAHSEMPTASPAWVRTVDGWEPSSVLTADSISSTPVLHPLLVASFQLGASIFVLIAFPYRNLVSRNALASGEVAEKPKLARRTRG